MTDPLVSVCLPVYNGARFLEAAVRSVLTQTYPHFELLVFDDASTDGSWELLQEIRDSRITLHRNDRNLGPEANWNQAVAAARGKYIKLFHQDDLLAPECLEKQVRALEDHPAAVLAFCRRHIIRPDGRRLLTRGGPWSEGLVTAQDAMRRCVRAGTNLLGEPSAVLFRAAVARQAGGFDGRLPYVIDLDYWFRLMAHGPAWAIDAPLVSFRVSPQQWSAALGRHQCEAFNRFVGDAIATTKFPVSALDQLRGRLAARLNSVARACIYRVLGTSR